MYYLFIFAVTFFQFLLCAFFLINVTRIAINFINYLIIKK